MSSAPAPEWGTNIVPARGTPRAWLAPAAVGGSALVACVLLGWANPGDSGPPLCPFRAATGLDCPGCGMTRAVAKITRGDLAAASDYNLALVLALPLVGYLYLGWLAAAIGVPLPQLRPNRVWAVVAVLVVAGFVVLRNLPVGPGRYLNSDPLVR